MDATLLGKGVFADVIKNLNTKLSWIILLSLKSSVRWPYKRLTEGEEERPHEDRGRDQHQVTQPHTRDRTPSSWSHQKPEESRKDSPTCIWRERSPNDTWLSDI